MTTPAVDGDPSLVELADAVFVTFGQLAVDVVDEMCTDKDAPELSETPLAPPQLSTAGVVALMAQPFQSPTRRSSDLVPVLVGRVSDSFTPDATPGPLLCTVIV